MQLWMSLVAGLPAELPKFQCKRQLGEPSERRLQADDDDWRVRSASSVAGDSDALVSANDSSLLDTDMDET